MHDLQRQEMCNAGRPQVYKANYNSQGCHFGCGMSMKHENYNVWDPEACESTAPMVRFNCVEGRQWMDKTHACILVLGEGASGETPILSQANGRARGVLIKLEQNLVPHLIFGSR